MFIYRRVSFVWIVLLAATTFSWLLGHGLWSGDVRVAGVAIILVAFLKIRCVLLEFMEIRKAPVAMRIVSEGWVALVCTGTVFFYCS